MAKAFRDSTVDKVCVKSSGDIADLRDAIKAKNGNKLAKVDSSDLKMFKHNTDLGGDSIEEDARISDLGEEGTVKLKALQVLVPESRGLVAPRRILISLPSWLNLI